LFILIKRSYYFVFHFKRIPELPPTVEGSDTVFQSEVFPSFEHATPQAVVSGGLRLCLETDTGIQQHVEKLTHGKYCVIFQVYKFKTIE
jgi:hypothetical protein